MSAALTPTTPIEASETAAIELHVPRRRSVGDSITHGALAMLSTQPLTWFASLLTTAALPRLLGADQFGEVTIAVTIAQLASIAAGLGASEYLVKRVSQSPNTLRRDVSLALLVSIVPTFLAAIAIMVGVHVFTPTIVEPRLLAITLVGGMLASPAQFVLLSSFRGRELHREYAWFNASAVVVGGIGGVIALYLGAGVLGYATVVSAAQVACAAVGWKISGLRPAPVVFDRSLIRDSMQFLRSGLPFCTWLLTSSITTGIDRVILGFFVSAAEVGWYAAAFRIVAVPVFIPTLVITPLFPALARSVSDHDTIRRTIVQTLKVLLLIMVPLSAGIIVVAPAVPGVLRWPADFDGAIPLMVILSLQLPLVAIDMVFGSVLLAIGLQKQWVLISVMAAVAKISLDLLAIPWFESATGSGAMGASVVTIIAELFMFAGAMFLIPKRLLDVHMLGNTVRIALAGVAVVIVGRSALGVSLVLAILAGAAAYGAAVLILRLVTLADLYRIGARVPFVRDRLARFA